MNQLNSQQRDELVQLRNIGKSKGFHDRDRLHIWMKLLDIDMKYRSKLIKKFNGQWNAEHQYVEQIKKDVNRSFNTIDQLEGKEDQKLKLRKDLDNILQFIFHQFPQYHYYQGLHDIVSFYLCIFQPNDALVLSVKTMELYLSDSLVYRFDQSVNRQMVMVFDIIEQKDPEMRQQMKVFEHPIFAMPWILTWFVHSINQLSMIIRLFDYLLSSPPHSILYLCSAFILQSKPQFDKYVNSQQVDHDDMGTLFVFFTNNLFESMMEQVENVIMLSEDLQQNYPIRQFQSTLPRQSSLIIDNYVDKLSIQSKLTNSEMKRYSGPSIRRQARSIMRQVRFIHSVHILQWVVQFTRWKNNANCHMLPILTLQPICQYFTYKYRSNILLLLTSISILFYQYICS